MLFKILESSFMGYNIQRSIFFGKYDVGTNAYTLNQIDIAAKQVLDTELENYIDEVAYTEYSTKGLGCKISAKDLVAKTKQFAENVKQNGVFTPSSTPLAERLFTHLFSKELTSLKKQALKNYKKPLPSKTTRFFIGFGRLLIALPVCFYHIFIFIGAQFLSLFAKNKRSVFYVRMKLNAGFHLTQSKNAWTAIAQSTKTCSINAGNPKASIDKNKAVFYLPTGVCRGICDSFSYLFFSLLKENPNLDQKKLFYAIAQLFNNGAPKSAMFFQDTSLCQIGNTIYQENPAVKTPHKEFTSEHLKSLQPGFYDVGVPCHAMLLFKSNDREYHLFDPNDGIYATNAKQVSKILKNDYSPKKGHNKIEINSAALRTEPLKNASLFRHYLLA